MTVVLVGTIGILVVSAVLGLIRLYTATDDASVAAVSDLLYFCAVGIVVMGAMATGSSITLARNPKASCSSSAVMTSRGCPWARIDPSRITTRLSL